MEIYEAKPQDEYSWNKFIKDHYPPVGAFMQTWEWGLFQQALARKIERHFVAANREPIAVFTVVHHQLPLGLSYGYIPRGPVFAKHIAEESEYLKILKKIRLWAQEKHPSLAFMRLEPPLTNFRPLQGQNEFYFPSYYVQPKKNHIVGLTGSEKEMLAKFHPSTRSNISRAEKRGVTMEIKPGFDPAEYQEFLAMAKDTTQRNNGKNTYPSNAYFRALLQTIPPLPEKYDPGRLSLGVFLGYQNQQPAAAHLVLFFGSTATYLYGASYSRSLPSKVSTYLHWAAMREAKKRGLSRYDLGGIDEKRWPTLTNFKRQFRGEELDYVGNIDIPLRPLLHKTYDFFRKWKR